jgi:hypothetical protein
MKWMEVTKTLKSRKNSLSLAYFIYNDRMLCIISSELQGSAWRSLRQARSSSIASFQQSFRSGLLLGCSDLLCLLPVHGSGREPLRGHTLWRHMVRAQPPLPWRATGGRGSRFLVARVDPQLNIR